MSLGIQAGQSRSKGRRSTRLHTTERAWASSVPALQAPPGLAPSSSYLRAIHDRYPEIHVMWDRRPFRSCFVLWEKTRHGHMVVLKDVPKAMGWDQRLLDYLALCDMASKPGIKSVLAAIDKREDERKARKAPVSNCDWDKVMWAAKKDMAEAESYPMGIHVQVPGNAP